MNPTNRPCPADCASIARVESFRVDRVECNFRIAPIARGVRGATRLSALLVTLLVGGLHAVAGAQTGLSATASAAPAQDGPQPPTPSALDPAWVQRIEHTATQAARAVLGEQVPVRVELSVGQLDPRLRLAPCRKVDVAMPAGHRPWGRTRIALRCVEGSVAWNVTLPLTVKVHAPALVLAQSLPAGTVLQAAHLHTAEVDWAETPSPVVTLAEAAVGRTLSRPLSAGQSLRQADLKQRQWFAAGDPVRIVAVGPGFAVSGEGIALTPGLEGQPARVRTESGRLVTGVPRADRRVEVTL